MSEIDTYLHNLTGYLAEAKESNNPKEELIFNTLIVYKGLTELLLRKIDDLENKIDTLLKK